MRLSRRWCWRGCACNSLRQISNPRPRALLRVKPIAVLEIRPDRLTIRTRRQAHTAHQVKSSCLRTACSKRPCRTRPCRQFLPLGFCIRKVQRPEALQCRCRCRLLLAASHIERLAQHGAAGVRTGSWKRRQVFELDILSVPNEQKDIGRMLSRIAAAGTDNAARRGERHAVSQRTRQLRKRLPRASRIRQNSDGIVPDFLSALPWGSIRKVRATCHDQGTAADTSEWTCYSPSVRKGGQRVPRQPPGLRHDKPRQE